MLSSPFVAYDLTRLFLGPAHVTPRGIDRVDIAYARHFLQSWPGDAVGTLLTPFGARVIERKSAICIVDDAEANWKEHCSPDDDPLLERLMRKLTAGSGSGTIIKGSRPRQVYGMVCQALRHGGRLFTGSGADVLPRNAVYLNTGQMGIAVPRFLSWLKTRPDIRPVFMLHDLIPLEYAEFVPASSSYFHNNMVANTAAHAAGLITTTRTMATAIRQELARRGCYDMPVASEALPVPHGFTATPDIDPRLAQVPYFVIVSSIEPRKNQTLLLDVWQRLVAADGACAPKLVIAGTRWHGHEAITGILKHSPMLKEYVIEVGGLSTPALHRLMSNARGLLMPSFAEGFGLPIIEAQALNVPVIASDIAAHREVGCDGALYLNAHDQNSWATAIRNVMEGRAQAPRPRPIRTWKDYFREIEPFLAEIAEPVQDQAEDDPFIARIAAGG